MWELPKQFLKEVTKDFLRHFWILLKNFSKLLQQVFMKGLLDKLLMIFAQDIDEKLQEKLIE